MAAHDVLSSPKIASAVLGHLSPGPLTKDSDNAMGLLTVKQRRENQAALAQLATVCRAVSSLALDVLWRYIDDFHHVLFALRPYDKKNHMFVADFTDTDWARFQEYALRVRELHVGKLERFPAMVWVLLTRWCPRDPLLPRLERLTGFEINTSSVCCTTLFSASMKSLNLKVYFPAEDNAVRMTIQAAQPALGSVTHLTIEDMPAAAVGKEQAIPFWNLTQLHTLHVVHKTVLTIPILQSLASFTRLRTLQLHINRMPEIHQPVANTGFLSLRDLTLSGRLGDICAFIAATARPNIESLTIDASELCVSEQSRDEPHTQSGHSTVRSLEPIYAKLTPSLRHFRATLRCTCSSKYHFPDSNKLLAPLRTLSSLRNIAFEFEGMKFHLADASIVALQDAWPDLVQFDIATKQPKPKKPDPYRMPQSIIVSTVEVHSDGSYYREPARPQVPKNTHDHPTVKTLALFAQAHPHLTTLGMPSVDLDALPALDSVLLLDHGLQHLRIYTLDGGVALFPYACALDMLFPRLDLADAARAVITDNGSRSTELQLLLLGLQAGRVGTYRMRAEQTRASSGPGSSLEIQLIPQGRYPEPTQNTRREPIYPYSPSPRTSPSLSARSSPNAYEGPAPTVIVPSISLGPGRY
ncbi:uncharacterized protein TRAVEDRAFT_74350 [Trametes versicolor FP-101664 SS1]|uniref:uncharacterized protein n=1 Tax=Trametes versicolor (strain FP-101664) TaxID=717944 RepID=UPI0004623BDF|nr:uncharacterized protein TRAVEDRAFT_74350 [Trametes versicolor FP-101664 SS1]EIW54070.1 hypothetical protein TRAVEDRAFT_74350 [Trametes versicolor FP-101664 SS1]